MMPYRQGVITAAGLSFAFAIGGGHDPVPQPGDWLMMYPDACVSSGGNSLMICNDATESQAEMQQDNEDFDDYQTAVVDNVQDGISAYFSFGANAQPQTYKKINLQHEFQERFKMLRKWIIKAPAHTMKDYHDYINEEWKKERSGDVGVHIDDGETDWQQYFVARNHGVVLRREKGTQKFKIDRKYFNVKISALVVSGEERPVEDVQSLCEFLKDVSSEDSVVFRFVPHDRHFSPLDEEILQYFFDIKNRPQNAQIKSEMTEFMNQDYPSYVRAKRIPMNQQAYHWELFQEKLAEKKAAQAGLIDEDSNDSDDSDDDEDDTYFRMPDHIDRKSIQPSYLNPVKDYLANHHARLLANFAKKWSKTSSASYHDIKSDYEETVLAPCKKNKEISMLCDKFLNFTAKPGNGRHIQDRDGVGFFKAKAFRQDFGLSTSPSSSYVQSDKPDHSNDCNPGGNADDDSSDDESIRGGSSKPQNIRPSFANGSRDDDDSSDDESTRGGSSKPQNIRPSFANGSRDDDDSSDDESTRGGSSKPQNIRPSFAHGSRDDDDSSDDESTRGGSSKPQNTRPFVADGSGDDDDSSDDESTRGGSSKPQNIRPSFAKGSRDDDDSSDDEGIQGGSSKPQNTRPSFAHGSRDDDARIQGKSSYNTTIVHKSRNKEPSEDSSSPSVVQGQNSMQIAKRDRTTQMAKKLEALKNLVKADVDSEVTGIQLEEKQLEVEELQAQLDGIKGETPALRDRYEELQEEYAQIKAQVVMERQEYDARLEDHLLTLAETHRKAEEETTMNAIMIIVGFVAFILFYLKFLW